MAAATKKNPKTETLSLRLDPKTKFIIEFVSRVRGQSLTTVVDRAIREASTSVTLSSRRHGEATWADFWDVSEGVRSLRLLLNENYPTTFEEDEILQFTKAHWEFFYTDEDMDVPRRAFLDILWPRLGHYLSIWQEQRQTNYWAAGEQMERDLSAARIEGPAWPRPPKAKTPTGPKEKFDLDDEIPF